MNTSPTVEKILGWHGRLLGIYGTRNSEFTTLRRVFDAQFVSSQGISANSASELIDNKKLVYNLINTTTRRFMDEMSAPISIIGVPNGVDQADLELSEKRQKLLSRIFASEKMPLKIIQAAFNQSLLDKAIFHVRPDPKKKYKVAIDLTLPESYLPLPVSDEWGENGAVIISWLPFDMENLERFDPDGRDHNTANRDENRVIEYWDSEFFVRIKNGKRTHDIHHDLGFIPFPEAHNIPIPHRQRGQGDSDQSIGLNEHLNQLISDQGTVLSYLANPIVIIRGSRQGTAGLVFGPRAIWDLERDGSAELLTWAGSPPSFDAQIMRMMQGIEDNTGISAPAFGRDIPSGVSGETVRSVLAGFNTRIGTKQAMMGLALNSVCVNIQAILEKLYPNEKFELPGESDSGQYELRPKDMKGFYDVQVVFQPQNETVRVFTELEKLKNGVQSKLTTMRRLGVPNPVEEMRRIIIEKMLDAKLQAPRQMGLEGQMPGQGMPGMPPKQPLNLSSIGDLEKQLNASNPGDLADLLGVPLNNAPMKFDMRDVLDRISDGQYAGRVFITGALAEDGKSDRLELHADRPEDIPQIKMALGPAGRGVKITTGETNLPANRVLAYRPEGS